MVSDFQFFRKFIYAQIYDRSGSYTGCLVLAVVVSAIQLALVPFIAGTQGLL